MAERSHWFRKERTPSIAEASAAERDQQERARLHEEVAALPGQLASPPAVASEPEPEEVPVPRTPQAAVPAAGLPLSRRSDATGSSASSRAGSRELATADEDLWAELRASRGEQLRNGILRLKRSAGRTRPDDGIRESEYDWQKLWRFFAHEMVTGDERSGYLDKLKFKELLRKRASIQETALINQLWRIACPADGRLPFCRVVRPSATRLRLRLLDGCLRVLRARSWGGAARAPGRLASRTSSTGGGRSSPRSCGSAAAARTSSRRSSNLRWRSSTPSRRSCPARPRCRGSRRSRRMTSSRPSAGSGRYSSPAMR